MTSYPFFLRPSTKGETATCALFSPVMKKMSFYPSLNLATYSFNEIYSSPLLLVLNLKNSASLALFALSSWIPSFKFFENCS
jgi:hypothetical protein